MEGGVIFQWVVGSLAFAFGLHFVILNIVLWRNRWRLWGRNVSAFMLVGGVLMSLGLLAMPVPLLDRWFWIPLVVDPWGLPISMVYAVVASNREKREDQPS